MARPIPMNFSWLNFKLLAKANVYFDAKWIVKRIHKPNFPVKKGYRVSWGQSGSDFSAEIDNHPPLVSDLKLDETIGKEFTLSFEVKKSAPGTGFSTQIGDLILENDATKAKFPKT